VILLRHHNYNVRWPGVNVKRNKCGSSSFCALCYSGSKGRAVFPGHYGSVRSARPRFVERGSQVKRSAPTGVDAGPGRVATDPTFEAKWPQVWAYLSTNRWDDGAPRETSTLMVIAELGLVKLGLNDRAEGRSLWVTGDGLDTALTALEDALDSGRADWRQSKAASSRKR